MRILDRATVDRVMDWPGLVEHLARCHRAARPQLGDTMLEWAREGFLVRSAYVPGMGAGCKAVTIYPGNPSLTPPLETINAQIMVFSDKDGTIEGIVDGNAETLWKTAADSALGARYLARPDSRVMLMVGAGLLSRALIAAHCTLMPSIERVLLWNRSPERAEETAAALRERFPVQIVTDLEAATRVADLISTGTMSREPLVRGAWLKPGAHLDLVGGYTAAMRETDDEAVRRARVFCNFRQTALDTGDLHQPIASGVLTPEAICGDLYDLAQGMPGRQSASEITLYKNGGGAHLDVMTARYALMKAG